MDATEIKQYIVFRLSNENYGLAINRVTTIEKVLPITRVPKTPDYMKGVINLRGDIIPVMDLRIKFNMEILEETDETRIIILKIEDVSFGIIVDFVEEVLELNVDDVTSASNISNDIELDYITGVARIGDCEIVTILSLDKLIKFNKE